MPSVKYPLLLLLPLLLVNGCQRPTNRAPVVGSPQQIEQLSALISGAMYLRQECQREDIPDESILMQTAMKLAMERNWDTKAPVYQALKGKSQTRYQALVEEIGIDNNQCSSLNLLLADFAYEARRDMK